MDVVLMKRTGIFFKLKTGKKQDYIDVHHNIWPEVKEALDEAGICNYSIWNLGEMLFAYYEVEDEERMDRVLAGNEAYQRWRDFMEDFVYKEPLSGTKEWPMEMVFYNKGKTEV